MTHGDDLVHPTPGEPSLTKREYFAALAMQGLLANPNADCDLKIIAADAVVAADALIAALNKTPEQT